jgi:hypothetical protein
MEIREIVETSSGEPSPVRLRVLRSALLTCGRENHLNGQKIGLKYSYPVTIPNRSQYRWALRQVAWQ